MEHGVLSRGRFHLFSFKGLPAFLVQITNYKDVGFGPSPAMVPPALLLITMLLYFL